jgi:hypothetical protein
MSGRRHAALVVLVSIAVFGMGCSDNPVGRLCDLGTATPQPGQVVIASPSLDCVSRTCLRMPLSPALCTAECSSDDDCDRVPESPCTKGFTCGVAVTVGPFCCRKFCICKDYVVVPNSGELATPTACDAGDSQNKCCNLPGRQNNADYPSCQ